MGHLIANIFRWVAKHFVSFVVIVAVLVGGKWFYEELQSARSAHEHLYALKGAQPDLANALLIAAKQVEQQIEQVAKGGFGGTATQELEGMLAKKVAEQKSIKSRSPFEGLPTVADFQKLAILEMEIEALKKATESAQKLEWLAKDSRDAREQWMTLSTEHGRLLDDFDRLTLAIQKLRADHPIESKVPGTKVFTEIDRLIDSEKSVKAQADKLRQRIENLKLTVELKERNFYEVSKAFGLGKVNVDAALQRADESIANEIQSRSSSFFWAASKDMVDAVAAQVLTAFFIVLGAIFIPIGIKLMFFYIIAPWASRQPPIQVIQVIQQTEAALPAIVTHGSEVSIALVVKPDEEMLIHSDYIQSSSINTTKTTKWFLDDRYPLTSIAAELYFLTRIAPHAAEKVVVSSGKSLETKIAVIDVPDGSAIVMQPRGLVGVLQKRSSPLEITSHWRFGHLHSWLTLQFRYLVLHGPVTLVVKGCRGVRMEPAGDGRLINQSATLGFSASALYSVRRCETFVSYLRGVEELFNDQFAGANCVYMYEEKPDLRRKGGIAGRWLEGLTDSVLKVFGI